MSRRSRLRETCRASRSVGATKPLTTHLVPGPLVAPSWVTWRVPRASRPPLIAPAATAAGDPPLPIDGKRNGPAGHARSVDVLVQLVADWQVPGECGVPVEVRSLIEVLVVTVEDGRRRGCGRRNDPGPVGRARSAVLSFPAQVLKKAGRLGVVIGDRDSGPVERVQNRDIEFGHSPVLPQIPVAGQRK